MLCYALVVVGAAVAAGSLVYRSTRTGLCLLGWQSLLMPCIYLTQYAVVLMIRQQARQEGGV